MKLLSNLPVRRCRKAIDDLQKKPRIEVRGAEVVFTKTEISYFTRAYPQRQAQNEFASSQLPKGHPLDCEQFCQKHPAERPTIAVLLTARNDRAIDSMPKGHMMAATDAVQLTGFLSCVPINNGNGSLHRQNRGQGAGSFFATRCLPGVQSLGRKQESLIG